MHVSDRLSNVAIHDLNTLTHFDLQVFAFKAVLALVDPPQFINPIIAREDAPKYHFFLTIIFTPEAPICLLNKKYRTGNGQKSN